jgi:hypothetical protein
MHSNPSTRISGQRGASAFLMSTLNGLYNPGRAEAAMRKRKDLAVDDATLQAASNISKNSGNFMRGEVSVFVYVLPSR